MYKLMKLEIEGEINKFVIMPYMYMSVNILNNTLITDLKNSLLY